MRVPFDGTGAQRRGRVLSYPSRSAVIAVVPFRHTLKAAGAGRAAWRLSVAADIVDSPEAPPNQRLDREPLANQQSRVLKERGWP